MKTKELRHNSSEDQLQSQGHGANPPAEEPVRSEKIGVGGQHEPLCRGCRRNAGGTEDIAVAKGKVRVVENVENIRLHQQVLPFSEKRLLADGEVQYAEAWCREAIPAHRGPGTGAGDQVSGIRIDRGIADGRKERVAFGIAVIEASATSCHAGLGKS